MDSLDYFSVGSCIRDQTKTEIYLLVIDCILGLLVGCYDSTNLTNLIDLNGPLRSHLLLSNLLRQNCILVGQLLHLLILCFELLLC